MNWLLPAGGGAALVLAAAGGTLWKLRRRRLPAPIETAEQAAQAADAALAGFNTQGAVLAADGMGALAVDRQSRVAVILRNGARLAVREIRWKAVRLTEAGLLIETGDRAFGTVTLLGIDALEVRRLSP